MVVFEFIQTIFNRVKTLIDSFKFFIHISFKVFKSLVHHSCQGINSYFSHYA